MNGLTLAALIALQPLAAPQDPDAPIATVAAAESTDALRVREAIAYANPMPRGAPEADYPLVAWCAALVEGHVALGRTLPSDPLDAELIRLGELEARDFRGALRAAEARATPAMKAAAASAEAEASAKWSPLLAQGDVAVRSQGFGLFFGLPGRCEHAARRIRENITTPPTTLKQAGLDENGEATGR